jgi:hypothetical protein
MPKANWNSERKDGARSRHRTRTTISWSAAGAESLRSFVSALTEAGCAVMFGRTTDGGALSLLVLAGNDKYREYITTPGDIMPTLLDVLDDCGIGELAMQETST